MNMKVSKSVIRSRIKMCGIGPNYQLHTGGFAGLPYHIDITNAATGFALQRTLRELAASKPDLFGEFADDQNENFRLQVVY